MQARTKKLKPVVQYVDRNEQEAMRAVGFSQQQLHLQNEILQKLLDYKNEYLTRHTNAGMGGEAFSVMQLQEFNRFIAQLDQTIVQQKQAVANAQREVEFKIQKWLERRSRSQAMHKVVERISAGEEQQLQASEQKIMDEMALRRVIKSS